MKYQTFDHAVLVAFTVWVMWHYARYSDGSGGYGIRGVYSERSDCSKQIPRVLEQFADNLRKFGDKDVAINLKLRSVTGKDQDGKPSIIDVVCLPDGLDPRPKFQGDKGLGGDFPLLQ
jgi:hypothetical protein